jgi:hypothetical protein
MTDTTVSVTGSAPTPGWRTSEFYCAWAVKILGALMASGVLGDGTTAQRIAGAALTLLGFLGYTYSRTLVKTAGALALVCLIAAPQTACGEARSRGSASVGAFLDCEAKDVAPLLPDAIALAKAAVMRWISGSGTVDAAGLKSDAAPLKSDLGKCAWDAAIAALATPAAPVKAGAPAASALAINGPALRAAWAADRAELGWAPAKSP